MSEGNVRCLSPEMSGRYEMRFTGSGGQGVILASVIFAEAAVIAGMNAVQSQAYGPEARGGMCKAETVISRGSIWFTKVTKPDVLLALTQKSLDAYLPALSEKAVVVADSGLSLPEDTGGITVVALPILSSAAEKVGRAMTANIVAVGAVNGILGMFDRDVLSEAVRRHIPAGTETVNGRALAVGSELAECGHGYAG